jgi:dodecin
VPIQLPAPVPAAPTARRRALQLPGAGSIMPAAGLTGEQTMADSVYKIIELVGTSSESWEKAAAVAVSQASKTLRDLRIAEVLQLDMQVQNGKVKAYRAKLKVSFKFEGKK